MILEEFDESRETLVNPENFITPIKDVPKIAVGCYKYDMLLSLIREMKMIDELDHSVCNATAALCEYNGIRLIVFENNIGAPCSAVTIQDLFTLGVEKILTFGSCGSLDKSIHDCDIIVPTSAIRDEGTSFHYYPASDEIDLNVEYLDDVKSVLDAESIEYRVGKTWTTDAIYRETYNKVKKRKEQGCICVEMECSANEAVARYIGKSIMHILYTADNLDGEEWEKRSLSGINDVEKKACIIRAVLSLVKYLNTKVV